MSNSQSVGLSVLSKEDFKNMAKQREKAKRDQTAKQAKIDATFGEPALPPSVSFEAPVKMSDNSDRGKLREALGLYEDFSIIIKQGKYNEVVGVERQPATPLPGKNSSRFFKPNSSSRHLNYPSGVGHATTDRHITSRQHKPNDIADKSATNKTDIKYKPASTPVSGDGKNKTVTSHISHHGNRISAERSSLHNPNGSRKSDQKPESSSANDQKPVNANPQKPVESDQNVNQSTEKDIVSQSIKQHQREPVLQSIKQELIGQSKPNVNQSGLNDQQSSSSKSIAKSNEEGVKQSNDGRTVLKVKEENRNGMNDAKVKHKPNLRIAENVEEMLKEFQVPQPLTGIQTPFIESKFPFQERVQDRKDLNVVSKSDSKDSFRHLSNISACQKVESDAAVRVLEEIQEKDSSSSSSSSSNSSNSSSSSSEDDDSSSDEENEGAIDLDRMINTDDVKEKSIASKSVKCEGTVLKSSNDSREPPKRRSLVAEKVPPLSTETTTKLSQETEQQSMRQPCSSSESSSSSSSESGSDSGSDSESDKDVSGDEAQHRTLHNTPTKLTSPDNMDTSPSPASKQWGLKQFLHKPTQLIPMATKPPSCEAPVSDKSDPDHFDEDTDMRRGADQIISDENPPSNDQDALYKTIYMSADEFSPPAPLEHKHSVLSPIKSPIPADTKSPLPAVISPLQFRRTTGSEKMHITTKVLSEPKSKERNALSSKANPDVSKLPRVRKQKQKAKPTETIDSTDSESDSYIDVVNRSSDSALGSPQKSLPLNIQKSQNYLPDDSSLCSSKPLTSSAKRKESKRDKLRKEKDSVKLKAEISPSGVPNRPYCDSKKTAPRMQSRSFADPFDDMLHYFPGEKPVSPLRNVLNVHDVDEMRKAGLAVSPVKPFPVKGNLSYEKAKPSVLVKLDLNLLGKVMCIDRDSENFLKPKSVQEHYDAKHQKVTSAKNSLPSVTKSKKVLEDTLQGKLSKSSKLSANSISDIDIIDKKYVPEREYISNSSLTRKEISTNQMKHEVPDFDSLLIREPIKSEALSDNVNDSECSSSDSEDEGSKHAVSVHVALSPSTQSSFSQSPLENKKRKLSTTRDDDSKRRKTLSRSPVTQLTRDVVKDVPHVEIGSGVLHNRVAPVESGPTGKRERHNSASSQHSTHSNVSQRSSHSQHSTSQRSAQGNHNQKRPRGQDNGTSHAVRLSSTVGKSHDRSKSTAVVTPVVKNETIDTSRQNGFVPETISRNAMGMNFHRNVFSDKEEEERLLSPDHYLKTAKKYKYQADDMECSLMKYVMYLESVLCFIQGGYAMEKSNMLTDASNMYKDTSKLVSHQFHQFRLQDADMSNNVKILTVLWLRIQSLVYLKLYMLKKNETVKLKRILEDHNSKSVKSSSQPKAPSAPSPHQPSWNRSTGTPSPMSPTPSPANSVCSVGSVGSDVTPSKLSNGNSQGQIAPPGSVIVTQRIHSITQKYFSNTCYLIQAHELWDQASITRDSREFFAQVDVECGKLTLHSSLLHLVCYVKQAIRHLNL